MGGGKIRQLMTIGGVFIKKKQYDVIYVQSLTQTTPLHHRQHNQQLVYNRQGQQALH